MKGVFLAFFAVLASSTLAEEDFTCGDVVYSKMGCYMKKITGTDIYPKLIVGDSQYDWENWGTYIGDLICRCIDKLKELKAKSKVKNAYRQISLRRKKECWSSEESQEGNMGALEASALCFDIKHMQGCSAVKKGQCIGSDYTQYIYDIDWEAKMKEMLLEGTCYRETIVICDNVTSTISSFQSTYIP